MSNIPNDCVSEGLTPQDIKALQAPLPLADHEAREKGTNKDKTKKQYLIYINQEGVIPLLNAIDPNWSWDVQNVHFEPHYVSVTGRLTIKGVSRDGVGGNSPNGQNSPVDEDTVKGAETDALKRAALRFGVGLYLRSTPTFWIPISDKSWEDAEKALKEFSVWYTRTFPGTSTKPGAVASRSASASEPSASVSGAGIQKPVQPPSEADPLDWTNEPPAQTKPEETDMRPDETEDPPNLHYADALIVGMTGTTKNYALRLKSGAVIAVKEMALLDGLTVGDTPAQALVRKTHPLNPHWRITADHDADGWRIDKIEAALPV